MFEHRFAGQWYDVNFLFLLMASSLLTMSCGSTAPREKYDRTYSYFNFCRAASLEEAKKKASSQPDPTELIFSWQRPSSVYSSPHGKGTNLDPSPAIVKYGAIFLLGASYDNERDVWLGTPVWDAPEIEKRLRAIGLDKNRSLVKDCPPLDRIKFKERGPLWPYVP